MPTRSISTLTEVKQPPTGLRAEEKIVEINNRAVTKIILDWQNVTGASKYRVYYRYNNGDFTQIETTSSNLEILNTEYEFFRDDVPAKSQVNASPQGLNLEGGDAITVQAATGSSKIQGLISYALINRENENG